MLNILKSNVKRDYNDLWAKNNNFVSFIFGGLMRTTESTVEIFLKI